MTPLHGFRRFLGILAAALQLAGLGTVVFHEAQAAVPEASHVEGSSGDACAPPHLSDCAACRTLSSAVLSVVTAPALPGGDVAPPPAGAVRAHLDAWRGGLPPTRAPPAELG